jgi:hypothetical protein
MYHKNRYTYVVENRYERLLAKSVGNPNFHSHPFIIKPSLLKVTNGNFHVSQELLHIIC